MTDQKLIALQPQEILRLLIDRGVNIHSRKDRSFRWASFCGRLEVVRLLIQHGADVHALDDEALSGAANNGHLEVVQTLLDAGADADKVLAQLGKEGKEDAIKRIQEAQQVSKIRTKSARM